MVGVGAHLGERRRGVDVPEDAAARPGRAAREDAVEQQVVEDADAARLDDDVGRRRPRRRRRAAASSVAG